MGRSVGFKCECGGWPKYEKSNNGKVVMNCNKCGWRSEMNEQWDEEKHGYIPVEPESRSGCFIATAAFGTALAPEVLFLRQYRNRVLSTSKYGRTFINVYYH